MTVGPFKLFLFWIAFMSLALPFGAQSQGWGGGIPAGPIEDDSFSYVPFCAPRASTNYRYQQVYRADNFTGPVLAGGGVWLELGGDALGIAECLAGPVRRIRLVESASAQGAEIEDEARVETDHGNGLHASLRLTWNDSLARPIARCIGDRGELSIGRAQTVLVRENGAREVSAGARDSHAAHVEVLRELLRERRSRERSIDVGAQSLAWLHAAYRSAASGRFELA